MCWKCKRDSYRLHLLENCDACNLNGELQYFFFFKTEPIEFEKRELEAYVSSLFK